MTLVDGRQHDYWRVDETRLAQAVALAEAVADGAVDLHALNRQSLSWRDKL